MSLMFLLSIHSCRMRTFLDPVSHSAPPTSMPVMSTTPNTPTASKISFPTAAGSLFRASSGRTADRMNGTFNWFLSTSRSGAGRWSPAWGWSTVVHVWFCGVQKRSHDREDPFGRKFLNSLLDTQASLFFLLAIWGLIWMTRASQTIDNLILLPEAFWSDDDENVSLQTMYSLTLLFFCFFHHQLCPAIHFKFNHFILYPPPPPQQH